MKAAELAELFSPGPIVSSVEELLQPSRFVNLSAYMETAISVSLSLTVMEIDRKVSPPVFLNPMSIHQLEHESIPRKDASKSGIGVGVGGGVYTGKTARFPVRVAYSPHSQQ